MINPGEILSLDGKRWRLLRWHITRNFPTSWFNFPNRTTLNMELELMHELVVEQKEEYYIVCLFDNGAILPSDKPKVHKSIEKAQKEAHRLCKLHDKKFLILRADQLIEPVKKVVKTKSKKL